MISVHEEQLAGILVPGQFQIGIVPPSQPGAIAGGVKQVKVVVVQLFYRCIMVQMVIM